MCMEKSKISSRMIMNMIKVTIILYEHDVDGFIPQKSQPSISCNQLRFSASI